MAANAAPGEEWNCLYSATDHTVYCYVPRAACSTMRIIWSAIHVSDELPCSPKLKARGHHTVQRRWPKARVEQIERGYIVVRHPFSRAISMYELACRKPELFFLPELHSPALTFRTFCDLLVRKDKLGELKALNEHIRPVSDLLLTNSLNKLTTIKLEEGSLVRNIASWYEHTFGADSDVAVRARYVCDNTPASNVQNRIPYGRCVVDNPYDVTMAAPRRAEYIDAHCLACVEKAYRKDYTTFGYATGCESYRSLLDASAPFVQIGA
jgi:hypothetical protein